VIWGTRHRSTAAKNFRKANGSKIGTLVFVGVNYPRVKRTKDNGGVSPKFAKIGFDSFRSLGAPPYSIERPDPHEYRHSERSLTGPHPDRRKPVESRGPTNGRNVTAIRSNRTGTLRSGCFRNLGPPRLSLKEFQ